ncbi:hypothetical protein HZH66_000140 [Vespula vulgaris]|uniref:Uncharacterized protein n=1 Tax=Vespula vulgaris TaxID=7454 RepID=A0A834NKK8_VESVU|nr:hypothetical protein HZH66_000140 [Vespula vulgaris]
MARIQIEEKEASVSKLFVVVKRKSIRRYKKDVRVTSLPPVSSWEYVIMACMGRGELGRNMELVTMSVGRASNASPVWQTRNSKITESNVFIEALRETNMEKKLTEILLGETEYIDSATSNYPKLTSP